MLQKYIWYWARGRRSCHVGILQKICSSVWTNKMYNEHASSYPHKRVHWLLKQGAFVVSIPLQDYINRIVHYMPYRSKAVQNLKHQLYPTKKEQLSLVNLPFSSNPNDIKSERFWLQQGLLDADILEQWSKYRQYIGHLSSPFHQRMCVFTLWIKWFSQLWGWWESIPSLSSSPTL